MDEQAVKSARILIVDDQEANILALRGMLEVSDFTDIISTTDPTEVVGICTTAKPDLIILDLHMPQLDGYEVMGQLTPWTRGSTRLPILVATADITPEAKRRALSMGARDFLPKPLDPSEVVIRVMNLLETRLLQSELREQNRSLEDSVRERTRELEQARVEVMERLSLAAEFRDNETGEHPQRVGRTAELLALQLRLPLETAALIRQAAPLHDLGKLGISDAILLKQGPLTPEEFEVMKSHVLIGAEILGRGRSRLMQMSEEIALTHHEWWDGSGYLSGLRGEDIPLSGRIVALADSFDALTHPRPYSAPSSVAEAIAEIRGLSGVQFDPRVVEAFEALDHQALLRDVEMADVAG